MVATHRLAYVQKRLSLGLTELHMEANQSSCVQRLLQAPLKLASHSVNTRFKMLIYSYVNCAFCRFPHCVERIRLIKYRSYALKLSIAKLKRCTDHRRPCFTGDKLGLFGPGKDADRGTSRCSSKAH